MPETLTKIDLKRLVEFCKKHEVGTIYVGGERCYVWVKGKGFVKAGPFKARMRKSLRRPIERNASAPRRPT